MRRISPAYVAYGHDIVMAAISFVLSLFLRMGASTQTLPLEFVALGTLTFTIVAAAVFWPMGLYRGVWRYASLNDVIQITKAVTLTVLIFLPVMFLISRAQFLPRSLPAINWLVLIVLLGGPRFIYRLYRDRRIDWTFEKQSEPRVPVLLIGAGDAAESFIRAMSRRHNAAYRVVGVVDEKGTRVGRRIHNVPVLGSLDELESIIEDLKRRSNKPRRLVVTKDQIGRESMQQLLDLAQDSGMLLSQLPKLTEFKAGTSAPIEVRAVDVEDLLGRPSMVLDRPAMQRLIAGKRVLITGAGGSIGSELVRQVADFGPAELCLVENSEFNLYTIDQTVARHHPALPRHAVMADVRDAVRLKAVFSQHRPELVFHAAAMKHVPVVETHPTEGILTNAIGTRNIADLCRAHNVLAMVLISTDKAVNPSSVMGATKRIAESYCQALDIQRGANIDGSGDWPHFVTVRFGNVLGSTGSVVPLFQKQLARGGPVTVTHPDMTRYFMTAREAMELVLQASAIGAGDDKSSARSDIDPGTIFVLDMGEPVKILDLANQIIRLADKRPGKDIEIVFTGQRPGEKIHEDLFHQQEPLSPTTQDGILLARPRTANLKLLSNMMDELEQTARAGNLPRALALLQQLVPEYTPETALAATAGDSTAAAV
ncbi:MAG: polysaccharide biosynthesis protein [Alphaproteobacteria bacterium]